MSVTVLWLIAGAVFIAVEIFGIPGLGFLFAGIGALLVGGAVELGLLAPEDLIKQFVLFFALSTISAALLWNKLKRKVEINYNNMIGDDAVVVEPGLMGSKEGQVKWSGTLMRAKIDPDCGISVLASESSVVIRRVDGNLLYVAPKP